MFARPYLVGLLLVPGAGFSFAGEPAPTPVEKSSGWVFELLPKPFQKNPRADFTVVTEMTELGRQAPAVSPAAPAYYIAQAAGYRTAGIAPHEVAITATAVEQAMRSALASSGFLVSTEEHPPTLVVVYTWGSHNLPDGENGALPPGELARNLLERAALTGGDKFARELAKAFEDSDTAAGATASSLPQSEGSGAEGMTIGAAAGLQEMSAMMDPVRLFRNRDPKNARLLDHTAADCYYVVASAYDYASVAAGKKQLLWRTRMTVGSQGVSQLESVPTMIATAGPYLGKDMTGAEILTRRVIRDGKVDVGTPTPVP